MAIYPILLVTALVTSSSLASPQYGAPVPKNRAEWITINDYPPGAQAARRTGKASFRVRVDKKGSVDSCEIVESSGHRDLDFVTCMRISERAIFEPARTAKGRAVAGDYQNSVRWQLP